MAQSHSKFQLCAMASLLLAAAMRSGTLFPQQAEIRRSTTGHYAAAAYISQSAGHPWTIQQSIGQASVIGVSARSDYTVRQGFIQPEFAIKASAKIVGLQAALFPNPFGNQFQISFGDKVQEKLDVQIFDLAGRMVYHNQFGAAQSISIDFPNAATGIYLVRVATGHKQYAGRIQKLNL